MAARPNVPKVDGIDRYYGGKGSSGTYQKIINCIRPHDHLRVLCLGHCSVTRHMFNKCSDIIGYDMDQNVIALWQAMNFDWIKVQVADAFDILENTDWASLGKVVIYLDPPYPISSRSQQVEVYKYELTDEQHLRLLRLIKQLPSNVDVLLSTYPNEMYKRELKGWKLISFKSKTSRGMATEWLFMNYQEIDELQDYTYVGNNYRERDRIKKKVRRWKKNFDKMPLHERQLIFKELQEDKDLAGVSP